MATLLFSFGGLFQVSILLLNAIAILSEDRFLARIGWGSTSSSSEHSFSHAHGAESVKGKIINLITSIRTLMRIPLIFLNVLIIVWAVAFG
ncbi:hypothetical protein AC579_7164 [Pseudocercospora musae]|uniref:Yos1-like protein n=1 Tax=Pseudocercospora musae TaxID=113226 RepID=A0A139I8T6_9PEZI|nr:hypothetical protein AC579_7164 [Pseudocercospora musae]